MLLPVHMTHFLPKAFHVLLLFLAFIAKAQNCKTTCGSGRSVPHPFGFSDGCTIRLNCSESTSEILLSNFTAQNITSTSIFLNLPAKCNRRVESMLPLFGPNIGPTWNNSLLFQSCPNSQNHCYIPEAFVQRQFALDSCKANNDSISCFATEDDNGSEIMAYNTLVQTKCKYLFGSIAVSSTMDSSILLGFITGFWTVCGSLVLHDSWRNSYLTFLNAIKDWIVKTAMYIARMQRS